MKTKKELVAETLRKNARGLTIIEISRILKFSRNTISIVLAELKGEGNISIRPIGKAKLHYWEGEQK
jgi:predicted transcriptional regulator